MEAVVQRLARDSCKSCVHGFGTQLAVRPCSNRLQLRREFALQCAEKLLRSLRRSIIRRYQVLRFTQKSRTLQARPRAHADYCGLHITHCNESVKRRIDPAVKRNVGRPLICGRGVSIAAKDLADRSPFSAAEIGIVMTTVNVLRDQIPDHAANDYVRRKMLLSLYARYGYPSG